MDTAEGSEGTCSHNKVVVKLVYNKNHQCILESTTIDGKERSRTETTYDAAGNVVTQATYYDGELISKISTTYKTVEVSPETAARLPQFKKAN